MLDRIKNFLEGVQNFIEKRPFVSVFIACGSIIAFMLSMYALSDSLTNNAESFLPHAWLRSLLHLGWGGIVARSVFFGLIQIDNNVRYNFGYRQVFGFPVLAVVIIALCQEFFPGHGDFFRENLSWEEKYKSILDLFTWTISAAYAMWTLYRNCDYAYAAKLEYLSKRKRETIDK